MARKRYEPPVQAKAGMMIDAVLMLVLVFVSLSAPLWIQNILAPAAEEEVAAEEAAEAPAPTWESLGQSAVMSEQWQKLGFDEAGAAAIIESKFDYSVDPVKLIVTVLLIVGYFVFMLKVSDKEYREVIAEKFD